MFSEIFLNLSTTHQTSQTTTLMTSNIEKIKLFINFKT
jgi:hypothetical protein